MLAREAGGLGLLVAGRLREETCLLRLLLLAELALRHEPCGLGLHSRVVLLQGWDAGLLWLLEATVTLRRLEAIHL